MTEHAEQLEMLGTRAEPLSVELQEEVVRRCRSRHDALRKCYESSGLNQQRVYEPLGLDQGRFSKILGGTKFLDPEMYFRFMDLCGNEIPLRYDAYTRGYELKPMRTDAQERIASLEQELAEERKLTRRLVGMLRGET